ncbi:hypothetical protein AB834_06870 [PVC group bacterium (ex Bugula neritina AB1)]|nr:hypothetical protein AB834_06870 [PVC group bacterium (ex Bugula neritina AB1)]
MSKIIELQNIKKDFHVSKNTINVLKDVSLEVHEGEFVSIEGSSGSGKSTLLHIIGLLDNHFEGEFFFKENAIRRMSSSQKADYRNSSIGFVFQFFHLLSSLTAIENIMLPQMMSRKSKRSALETSLKWLDRVGLGDRGQHFPKELSGGEQQRLSLARALSSEPMCILLDEPTGNLDSHTSLFIQSLIEEINEEHKVAMILVTHDQSFAKRNKRQFRLAEGVLFET